jgi:enoyl-CoA hydratase/carnithine racemase
MTSPCIAIYRRRGAVLLRLQSQDGMNRLTRTCVLEMTQVLHQLRGDPCPLIITGNQKFFSAGADLQEIAALTGAEAYRFSRMGWQLMNAVASFSAPVYAAIYGYCMGGGLDLALACHRRVASPNAILGHRGAALGLMTGWGGTQRLSHLIGKPKAMEMFVAAEKIYAPEALSLGLVDAIAGDPIAEIERQLLARSAPPSR